MMLSHRKQTNNVWKEEPTDFSFNSENFDLICLFSFSYILKDLATANTNMASIWKCINMGVTTHTPRRRLMCIIVVWHALRRQEMPLSLLPDIDVCEISPEAAILSVFLLWCTLPDRCVLHLTQLVTETSNQITVMHHCLLLSVEVHVCLFVCLEDNGSCSSFRLAGIKPSSCWKSSVQTSTQQRLQLPLSLPLSFSLFLSPSVFHSFCLSLYLFCLKPSCV